MSELVRINKRMAELGLCSRREADALIEAGVVYVEGTKAELGQKVFPTAVITIDKKGDRERVYLAYYKGRGIISHSPDESETDIKTKLHELYGQDSSRSDLELAGVYPVGRLDKDSEGLIILTNDGRVTAPLLDPKSAIPKVYEVEIDKPITNHLLKHLTKGVDIEGYQTKPAEAKQKSPKRLLLTLREGKKHQIRRMCAALGFQVQTLKRIQIANIALGNLKPNQYRKIAGPELATFLKLLTIENKQK